MTLARPSPLTPHPSPKGDLDDAVLDRMDEALEFGLPGTEQREKLLALYVDRRVGRAHSRVNAAQGRKSGVQG